VSGMSRVSPSELIDQATRLLQESGADERDARTVSEVLVWADHRGRFTQGTIWVETLCASLRRGDLVSPARIDIISDRPAAVALDAGAGFGHVAAVSAVRTAAERALAEGVAIVTVRNSSHFGACGYYASRLAEQGMVGIVATNAYPKVAPHGARSAALGTNPIGFAAPVDGAGPIVGDLSTGALAGSRVRDAVSAGRPLEEGTALDRRGDPTRDPAALADGGVMLPCGGPKGYALGILVEIHTSGLSGGAPPDALGSMFAPGRAATSHVMIAIASDAGLPERVSHLGSSIRSTPPQDGMEVRLPGDVGHVHEARDTIDLPAETEAALARAADLTDPPTQATT
jgi:LDH2 family malate/lactate/ureidoglycolate dehydrogenase